MDTVTRSLVQVQAPDVDQIGVDQILGMPYLRLSLQEAEGATAITPQLLHRLHASLDAVDSCRFVLIEGGPGSFCQGLDLEQFVADHWHEIVSPEPFGERFEADFILEQYAALLDRLSRVQVPVIAVVDGYTLGGGVGLAAVADLVLASPQASFALPEAIMGLIPAVVFPYLARRIGVPRARLMALGLRPLTADAALQWGLVDEVTQDPESALHSHIRRFSRMAPHAVAAMKSLVSVHFPIPSDYLADAVDGFYACLTEPKTRQRLQRFAMGETPWPEEDTP